VWYVYWQEHGKYLVVDLWVPLDFCIFLAAAIYAYLCHRKTLKRQRLKRILDKSPLVRPELMEQNELKTLRNKLRKRKMSSLEEHVDEIQR
jgi:hypothetical protein